MQMDLFKRALKKPAIVVAFPVDRRAYLVKDTARELGARSYIAGRKFWCVHIQALRAQLRGVGIPRRQVDIEIRRYSAAVTHAIDHLLYQAGPDTAA
ncbi:DUF6074 family protein [Mesorhizobium caraganae]|uniref:DUF6074 family protein n=1 Tax=Mesorhizobium caraganae TaxID=483206 RepID=UPI003ED16615